MSMNINNGYNNYSNIFASFVAPIKRSPVFCAGATNPIAPSGDFLTTSSELSPYLSTDAIKELMLMNPKVSKILRENGLPEKININELQKLANGHLKTTKSIAAAIIHNLSPEEKEVLNQKAIYEAATFHDFGKVLIPEKILNKKGGFNEKERAIMELHSELGYELLKTQNISRRGLELIKYHHQTPDNNGYPENKGNFEYNLETEILILADKYSALTENRPYKKSLSAQEALSVIEREHPQSSALNALKAFVQKVEPMSVLM